MSIHFLDLDFFSALKTNFKERKKEEEEKRKKKKKKKNTDIH